MARLQLDIPTPIVLHPSPFRLDAIAHTSRPGQTIAEILRDIPEIPPEILTHGVVRIGEWEIPREHWARVRPRPGSRHMMHIYIRPGDGGRGGGGGKNVLALIATIALVVAVTAISGGILGPAGALSVSSSLFAAGSTSAALAAAGVSIVGALAINALVPPPSPAKQEDTGTTATLGAASIQGNTIGQFEPIPFVAGTMRVTPPFLTPPFSESINDDQFVYAIVGLNGAHTFSDIRINDAGIGTFSEVEYEVRDVVNDDSDLTLITKQVFPVQVGSELSPHKVQDDVTNQLQDTATPSNSYPTWSSARTRNTPDEVWLTFVWTGLVNQETSGGTVVGGMPMRVRIRQVGATSWINLPEFHVQRERLEPFRGTLKLKWRTADTSLVRPDQNPGRPPWKYAFYAQNSANGEGFDTHSYFNPGSGNLASNALSDTDGVLIVFLDPATFPKGTYEVQVQRGYGYRAGDFSSSGYTISSAVPYFFTHTPATSPPTITKEQAKVASKVNWDSISSAWDEYPLLEKGMSLLAVKAKNISIQQISMVAQGWANIYDGTDWDAFEPTNNPAAWWRYLALGGQSVRAPFIEAQLDDDALTEWYDFCGDRRTVGRTFDGAADYLTRGAGLTGASDSSMVTGSVWVNMATLAGTQLIFASAQSLAGAADRFQLGIFAGSPAILGYDTSGVLLLNINAGSIFTDGWGHLLFSVDMTNPAKRHFYFNDANALVTNAFTSGTLDFTSSDWSIGAGPNGGSKFSGGLADLWFAPGVYIDMSIEANRRKFISATGRPVDLGATGQLPTGTAPRVYLSGRSGAFETNKGTGGGFTLNGSPDAVDVIDGATMPTLECNAYFSGTQSAGDAMRIIGGTGQAASRISDRVGVIIERDRSDEGCIAHFNQRNSRGLAIRRAFPRVPDGFRIRFNDEGNDYKPTEIIVYRNPDGTDIEAVDYIGITNPDKAQARAYLDMKQLIRRPALYTLETDIQNLYCTKGSLVALAHDTIRRHYDSARIDRATMSGGNMTGLVLDNDLRLNLLSTPTSGATFDGITDYLTRDGGLTGAADSKLFTASFWVFLNAALGNGRIATATTTLAGGDANRAWQLCLDATDRIAFTAKNSAGTEFISLRSDVIPANQWVHVLVSVDASDTAKRHVYIDDVAGLNTVLSYSDDVIDFTRADHAVAAFPDGTFKLNGSLAELWFQTGLYIDFSIETNRRRFISERRRPIDLGATGQLPTGSAPLVYLSANSGVFYDNKGTGDGFTLHGTDSTTHLFSDDGFLPAGVLIQLKDGSTLTAEITESAQTDTVTFNAPQSLPAMFSNEGAWTTATAYAVDDVVTDSGVAYTALVGHTSGATTRPGVGASWVGIWEELMKDCLVSSGPFSSVEKRMLVLGIKPQNQFTASLTLIDEAAPVPLLTPDSDGNQGITIGGQPVYTVI